jgi:hemoglobin/transferrin/lactoferrin receptor protein
LRAPNLSDLTRFDASRSGETEIPAPDLREEKYLSFEIGSKLFLDDLGVQGYGSYHYTFIDGMIVRFPTGATLDGEPVVTKDNVGDGFVQGVELGLSWNFYGGFAAFGMFTWLEGDVDTVVNNQISRRPMSRIQPLTGLVGVRWDSPGKKYWVEGTMLLVDGQDRLSPRDKADTQRIPPGGTPGYVVATIRGGVEVREGLHLFAAVENIGDADYRVHGSGQNEVGTNVILGADWRF